MNLLTSYRWLRDYLVCDLPVEEFAARLSLSGPAIEKIIPRDAALKNIVVAKILSVEPHPQADRLRVLKVDVGSVEPLTIVCGGSNLAVDQFVVVALVGASVKWHGEGEPVILELTKIRGIESQGMVCGADEIGLAEAFPKGEEKEILDLANHLPPANLVPGRPLAEALDLAGDYLMDIEVTTNRSDAMSIVGLAREAWAILKTPFKAPDPAEITQTGKGDALQVSVEDKQRCLRYMAVKLEGVTVGESPWWMKERLLSAGLRPINSVVDITNYVMLELGQPLHAFDADKLVGDFIRVRGAKAGEAFKALDGKDYKLESGMLVIADDTNPIAIAGVMGGELSGVRQETKNVIFEAASFDSVAVRRTARALSLYSDAQSLFEKGLSTEAPPLALARAVELCLTLAGGAVASPVSDSKTEEYKHKQYSISLQQVRSLIGVDLPTEEMVGTLERLGFTVDISDDRLTATVPWWRDHDIEDGRDLVEEIARVHGYANLPSVFPAGISIRPSEPMLDVEDKCRTILQGAGYTDVYSYAFVSAEQVTKTGCTLEEPLRLLNPLAADLEYMRLSLLPGMLQVIVENQERLADSRYMEVANVFIRQSEGLPEERPMLLAAVSGDESVWKQAKGVAETLLQQFGLSSLEWKPINADSRSQWHPGRSARILVDGTEIGRVGELHPIMAEAWKLNQGLGLCEIDLITLQKVTRSTVAYKPLPAFPSSKRDLAFTIDREITVEQIKGLITSASTLPVTVEWFDTYVGKGVEEGKKSLAFHLIFQEQTRTLSSEEVETQLKTITETLSEELGAVVRT